MSPDSYAEDREEFMDELEALIIRGISHKWMNEEQLKRAKEQCVRIALILKP